jgi:hypothetical protein
MEANGGYITTEELIPKLRGIMKPSGEDIKILAGRADDKFSQKVRNLKAHNTFERLGYAEYKNGIYCLSPGGKSYLEQNRDILNYLLINDFAYSDIVGSLKHIIGMRHKKTVQVFDENLIIQEGIKEIVKKEIYKRSKALRDYSLVYFSDHGGLNCHCCGFNFVRFYGREVGDNFIEMHHIKPIFQYADENLIQTIKIAVANIIPLCSNCHRMIHRNRRQPLCIDTLIKHVKQNGFFYKDTGLVTSGV